MADAVATTQQDNTSIQVRRFELTDTGAVLDLMKVGLGGGPSGTRDERFWRWKHLDNPFGESIALLATSQDGRIVGLRTFMQWRFRTSDGLVRAVRAVDTVTHPDYRRHGVFSMLTRAAIARAKDDSIQLIFNTPNKDVLPGYLKLGWQYVSMARPLVKVLNYPRFAFGLARDHAKRRSSAPPNPNEFFRTPLPSMAEFLTRPELLDLLLPGQEHTAGQSLATDQTMEYLQWRYCQYPNATYFVVPHEMDGRLSGCAIVRPNVRFGLREVKLDELFLAKQDEATASTMIRHLTECIKADYIIAYFAKGSFNSEILHRNGFHQAPKGGMNFAVNPLAPHLRVDPTMADNWSLSLGDLEVF